MRLMTVALAVLLGLAGPAADPVAQEEDKQEAVDLLAEGRKLYDAARYGEALLKFEEAVAQGAQDGELFYQMGYCYRTVRQDEESARASMEKAQPLLEAKLQDPKRRDLSTYYYLAAIALNEIPDADRVARFSREGIAAVEKKEIATPSDGEGLFQLGRLHGFVGDRKKSLELYESTIAKLEEADEEKRDLTLYLHSMQAVADASVLDKDWKKAATMFSKIIEADPARKDLEPLLALCYLRSGDEASALKIWSESDSPRMLGERPYLVRIISQYTDLGNPRVEAPEGDEALRQAILAAGRAYGEVRARDDEIAKQAREAWMAERAEELDKKRRARKQAAPGAESKQDEVDWSNMSGQQRLRTLGIEPLPDPPAPAKSPDRIAAEKKFFGLLMELVQRGQMVRDFALSNGMAPTIFR